MELQYRPKIEELKEKRSRYHRKSEEYGKLTDNILNLYYRWVLDFYHNGVYSILSNSHDGPIYLEIEKLLRQDLKNNVPKAQERIKALHEYFEVSQNMYIPD